MREQDPFTRSLESNVAEYEVNMHAIQSCIALGMHDPETKYSDMKHHQVGIMSLFVNDHAIAELLIAKGVFTKEEYLAQLVLSTRAELERLTAEANERLARRTGNPKPNVRFH